MFQEALGTTRAKVSRIEALAGYIATCAGLSEQDVIDAKRAAYLAKADLVTSAVVEFTSVQGIMGSYYAKAAGETDQVAQAIADHYKPRFAGDTLPASLVGKAVACADKIDTICGLFAVNQAPTGSSDPFALRRQAIGVINILDSGLAFSLVDAISEALSAYAANGIEFDIDAVREQVVDFFITRTKVNLRDAGAAQDAIDAVLATGVVEPAVIMTRVRALEAARANKAETFDDLATAYARANNLRDVNCGENYDNAIFNEIEAGLANAIVKAKREVETALVADDYATALQNLADLRKPIDAFFDGVMVMDEDAKIRENRLRLLNSFVSVFANVADFGLMAKSK